MGRQDAEGPAITVIGEAFIAVKPDTQGFGANAEKGVLGSVTSIAKKAAAIIGGAFVVQKGFDFLKDSVAAARESNAIAAQTTAVIKSTGAAANVTAKDVDGLSNALSRKTGVDDEAITKAQNLLLTFTNVRNEAGKGNDVFNQATATLVDMGAALGTDASGAAIQLGKALNDPIAGIAALSRVGVTFNDEQKKTIENLVKTGKTAEAQKIILAELGKEFGGSAEAQATASDKLKVALGNIQEEIGNKLIPIIDKAATFIADHLPEAMETAGRAFSRAKELLTPIAQTIRDVFERLVDAGEFVARNADTFKVVAGVIATILIPHYVALATAAVVSAAKQVASWVATQAQAIASTVVHSAQVVLSIGKWVAMGVAATVNAAVVVAGWVATAAAAVAQGAIAVAQFALQVAGWVGVAIQAGISAAAVVASWLAQAAAATANAAVIAAAWLVAYGPIIAIGIAIAAVAVVIVKNWDTIKNAFLTAVNFVIDFLKNNWPTILAILTGPIGLAVLAITKNWDTIKSGVTAVYDWVRDKFTAIASFISGMPSKIASAASGMWNGITAAFKSAINAIIRGWNAIQFKIPGFSVGPVSFGGFTLGVPDIPTLAHGALVRRTPGGIIANIAEGATDEAVLPLPPGVIEGLQEIARRAGSVVDSALQPLVGQMILQGATIEAAEVNAFAIVRELKAEAWRQGK